MNRSILILILISSISLYSGCRRQKGDSFEDHRLRVAVTTTILGDVVEQIGGDNIRLDILLPVGANPHSFEATPADVSKLSNADLIFINGLGLEQSLERLFESTKSREKLVSVSRNITELGVRSEECGERSDHPLESDGQDPHVWYNPNLVMEWVGVIADELARHDSTHTAQYQANAANYIEKLQRLDQWIQQQISVIPRENRKLVTDHLVFGYFAERYGFQQVGTIIPSFSTLAEPAAQEIAALESSIRKLGVKAIFVGNTGNPVLARRIALDTGVHLVPFYTGSLSAKDGEAASYIEYMRYNVTAIVESLK